MVEGLSRPHYAQAFRYAAYLSWRLPELGGALSAGQVYVGGVRRLGR